MYCPIERTGTELDASLAQFLYVFEEGIAMFGCRCEDSSTSKEPAH